MSHLRKLLSVIPSPAAIPGLMAILLLLTFFLPICPTASFAEAAGPDSAVDLPDDADQAVMADYKMNDPERARRLGLDAVRRQHYREAVGHFSAAINNEADSFYNLGLATAQVPGYELRSIASFKEYLIKNPKAPNAREVRAQISVMEERFEARLTKILDQLQEFLIASNDEPLEDWYPADTARLRREHYRADGWYLASARYFLGDARGARKGLKATNGGNWEEGWLAQWKSQAAKPFSADRHRLPYDTAPLVVSMVAAGEFDDALELMAGSYDRTALDFLLEQGKLDKAREMARGESDGWLSVACYASAREDGPLLREALTNGGTSRINLENTTRCQEDNWWASNRFLLLLDHSIMGVLVESFRNETMLAEVIARATADNNTLADFDAAFTGISKLAMEYRKVKGPAGRRDEDPLAYYYQGLIQLDGGSVDAALEDFDETIRLAPDFGPAYSARGEALSAQGYPALAMIEYNRALELNPSFAKAALNRGVARERLYGEIQGAIEDFSEAISLDPDNADAYNYRGLARDLVGNKELAVTDYNEAIRLNPKFVAPLVNRGESWIGKGEYDKAIADLDAAIQLSPKLVLAIYNRGVAWQQKGDVEKALADYSAAIELNPYDDALWLSRGTLWDKKGDTEKALTDLNEAIRLRPDNGKALYARGLLWMRNAEGDKALADFNAALRYDARNGEILSQRGLIYLRNGEFERSIADFDGALATGKSGPELFCSLGLAWWGNGDAGKAIEACGKAVMSDPSFPPAYALRGLAHFSRGDFSEAAADFAKSVELEPSAEGDVWKYLAQARSGRTQQAQSTGAAGDADNWYLVVLRYLEGGLSGAQFIKAAEDQFPAKQRTQLCEAHLFTGERLLIEDKQPAAADQFRQALDLCDKYGPEYLVARYESERQVRGAAPIAQTGSVKGATR